MSKVGRPKQTWGWGNPDKLKCPGCRSTRLCKNGSVGGRQKYKCLNCKKSTIHPKEAK